jgi:hypothetical protein
MKFTDKIDSARQRLLVFGGPKSGKTKLVGDLSSNYNLWYFDLENGYKTLRQLPHEQQARIQLFSIPDTKVFPIAIETLLKVITGQPVNFCVEHGKVGCSLCKKDNKPVETVELNSLGADDIVVVDSGTQLALSAMSHIKKNDDELEKPSWDDFAKQGFLMDKFLSQCQQAKFNLCFITHEVETELENGGKKLVPVAGTREFSRNTAKYFDHVVYCELKNKKHQFGSATDYAMSVLTGSRSGVSIERLDKPSLLPFFYSNRVSTISQPDSNKLVMDKRAELPVGVPDKPEVAVAVVDQTTIPITTTPAVILPQSNQPESIKDKLARLKLTKETSK